MSPSDLDSRLAAALRHAPDVDQAPPAALDQRILQRARSATQAQTWWRRLGTALDGLLQPAPAAALATLVLGTVIGLMWQAGPPPEALRDAPAQTPAAPAKAVGAASIPPAVLAPVAPAHTPPAVPVAETRRVSRAAPPVATQAAPVRAEVAAAPPAPPAPTPAPPPATLADAKSAAVLEQAAPSAAKARMMAAGAAGPRPDSAATPDPLASAIAGLAESDPSRSLLRDLQQAAQGRWQRLDAAPTVTDAPMLLDVNGRALGHLRVDDTAAWWLPADGTQPHWRASLGPATLAALRERLGKKEGLPRK